MASHAVTVRLHRSVSGLGNEGDVRRVAFGYARNFLLPRGLATIVSERAAAALTVHQQATKANVAHERQAVIEVAALLDGRSAELMVPMNAEGRLFASIQADDVAAAFGTDPIFRMQPIKQAGEHQLVLDFGHEIVANITVNVRPDASARRRKGTP